MRYVVGCCLALMIFGLSDLTVAQNADRSGVARYGEKASETSTPKKEDCGQIMHRVEGSGRIKSRLSSTVLQSAWLNKMVAYDVKGQVFVIAFLKGSGEQPNKKQVYCGIPYYKWDRFNFDPHLNSYDKRFEKYIKDYHCDCQQQGPGT